MDMKTINRMTEADLDPVQRCINALKLWDDMLTRAKAAGGEWLLGGLEGYEMRKLSYVDLALFWKIRTLMPMLEEIGFDALVDFVKRLSAQEGIARLFSSGRLMPAIAQPGYVF